MPDPILYLLRHGETEFNVGGRYQWQRNSPLTARAIETDDRLKEMAFGEWEGLAEIQLIQRSKSTPF